MHLFKKYETVCAVFVFKNLKNLQKKKKIHVLRTSAANKDLDKLQIAKSARLALGCHFITNFDIMHQGFSWMKVRHTVYYTGI